MRFRHGLAATLLTAGVAVGGLAVTGSPAQAQIANKCQDLTNQAEVYRTYSNYWFSWGNFYLSQGDYDDASLAFQWSNDYNLMAEEQVDLATNAGC
jgi:hypothetical protein